MDCASGQLLRVLRSNDQGNRAAEGVRREELGYQGDAQFHFDEIPFAAIVAAGADASSGEDLRGRCENVV